MMPSFKSPVGTLVGQKQQDYKDRQKMNVDVKNESDNDDDFAFEKGIISSIDEQKASALAVSRVLDNVLGNCTFHESDILECVKNFLKADQNTSDELVKALSSGLGKLIAHQNAKQESVEALFYFFGKIAVRCHLNGCDLPLCVIRQEVDGFSRSSNAFARARACLLVSYVFQARMDEINASENGDPDTFRDSSLPSSLALQWAAMLTVRRVDRDPKVRSVALLAISNLPCKSFYDNDGSFVSPKTLIIGSLRDESMLVRETAIKLAPLITISDIDECLQYFVEEESISGQLLMASKIAKNVHIDVYKPNHFEIFLNFLLQSKNSSLEAVVSKQLIPFWLSSLKEDWDFESTFGATLCLNKNLPAFPTALLNYLRIVKCEDISVKVMIAGFTYFMELSVEGKDGVAFINFLKDVDKEYRDSYRIHDKDSISVAIRNNETDLYFDLFAHRCLVDFIFEIYRYPHLSGPRDIALTRLLPNIKSLSELLLSYLKDGNISKNFPKKFFCVRQICAMIRRLDQTCSVGRQAWKDALYYIISCPSFTKHTSLIEFAVHEVLEYALRGAEELDEFTNWLCYSICELVAENENEAKVDFELYHRCGVMLNSILHYASVEKVDALMKNAFIKLIKNISLSTNIHHRILGCSLIGLVCTLDDFLFQNYVHLIRHSIEIDDDEVKNTAIIAIADVIISRDLSSVAKFAYPELSQMGTAEITNRLLSTLERVLLESNKKYEVSMTENLLRLMYCSCFRWPKLIGTILFKAYLNTKSLSSQLFVVFNEFMKHFIQRGPSGGMQLIAGYLAALDIIDDRATIKFNFSLMTTFVTTHLEVCPSKSPGFDGESQISVSLILVLLFAILDRLTEFPEQMSSSYLAHSGLNMINLGSVNTRYLEPLLRKVRTVYKKIQKNEYCEDKVCSGVQKFLNYVQKMTNERKFVGNKNEKCEV